TWPARSSASPSKDSELEVTALLRDATAGRVPSLLLLHGPEVLLVEEVVEHLTRALLSDDTAAGWNRELLHADQIAPEALVAGGPPFPLSAARRPGLARGGADLPAKSADRLRDALAAARSAPGGWPAEGTTVLLVAAGADRRAAGLRVLPDAAQAE